MTHGRIEVIAQCGGGPNGAALGPDGRVYICNNGGLVARDRRVCACGAADQALIGSIQAVNLRTGAVETLYDACQGEPLKARTISSLMHTGFYFTDLGKRGPRWMDRGAVYYARPDQAIIGNVAPPGHPKRHRSISAVCSGPKTQS